MDYYLERLETELKNILSFWTRNIISKETGRLKNELDNEGADKNNPFLGSLYLSRIIYGASAACRFLETEEYKFIAEIAFKELYEKLRNPAGGYFWGIENDNKIIHDKLINLAQANVLNGLSEYTLLTKSSLVATECRKIISLFNNTIRDSKNGGYLDGWDKNWSPLKKQTQTLTTHLSLLVAYTKYYEYSKETEIALSIEYLIETINKKFVDNKSGICIYTLNTENENISLGTNAQVSWLTATASKTIGNKDLLNKSCNIGLKITDNILSSGFDKEYGGVYNLIKNGKPIEKNKNWWTQAEVAIASLQAYQYTKNKTYLSYAIRLIEYIENTFSDEKHGEWYSEVSREGIPNNSVPKIHLWKALYHNVRYCIEIHNRLKSLIENLKQ